MAARPGDLASGDRASHPLRREVPRQTSEGNEKDGTPETRAPVDSRGPFVIRGIKNGSSTTEAAAVASRPLDEALTCFGFQMLIPGHRLLSPE